MARKPIAAYCKQEVHGWNKLPQLVPSLPGEEGYTCSFLNDVLGLHMLASVKDVGVMQVIHLSLAPVKSFDHGMSNEDWNQRIFANMADIAESFFPGRQFARQPDDPRRPSVIHYFAILGVDE